MIRNYKILSQVKIYVNKKNGINNNTATKIIRSQ